MGLESYWAALERVTDPEWPLSVVDLGLIYDVQECEDGTVEVTLTYTSVGCPCMEWIQEDIRARLREQGAANVRIRVVWDPPWTAERLTPKARAEMRKWGVAIP
ncbi:MULTISPECIES: metal-sulfur cluster assembly factor [Alicyclobacillus]|uniref:Phenylacetate-CoA oxygenase, PaaJ subunit n=1 Tax=Alicyclobacillus vulcanalis TaxID=252246 RepID=A0A1N7LLC3_9BACL|nr:MULTISPECIES: metal-sulfur cluster assembly factor [Alicyclobacillus]SIS74594.1 phenylacetate-CoA oxygenase, PaaJ subunit [Alicyclobacillus vulcanalis]